MDDSSGIDDYIDALPPIIRYNSRKFHVSANTVDITRVSVNNPSSDILRPQVTTVAQ